MRVFCQHHLTITLPVVVDATHRPGIEPEVTRVTVGGRDIWPAIRDSAEHAEARAEIAAWLLDEDREQLREAAEAAGCEE